MHCDWDLSDPLTEVDGVDCISGLQERPPNGTKDLQDSEDLRRGIL